MEQSVLVFFEGTHAQESSPSLYTESLGYGDLPGSGGYWWRGSCVRPMPGDASTGEQQTCPYQALLAGQTSPSLSPDRQCWRDIPRLAPRPPRRNPVAAPQTAPPPGDAASASPASRYGRTDIACRSAGCCPLVSCTAPRTAAPGILRDIVKEVKSC